MNNARIPLQRHDTTRLVRPLRHTYIHTYNIYRALRSRTNQKRWMALDHASYSHRNAVRDVVVVSLDLNEPSLFNERRPGLNEFYTNGTETYKRLAMQESGAKPRGLGAVQPPPHTRLKDDSWDLHKSGEIFFL